MQWAAVALLLGVVGLAVAQGLHFDGQISRAATLVPDADPAEVSSERIANVFGTVVIGIPALLLAVCLAVTAVPVRRGSNLARIFVFVGGGVQLLFLVLQCCGGFLFAPLFFALESTDVPSVGDVTVEGESKFLETLYSDPDTFSAIFYLTAGFGALAVLVLTGAVVLLVALPPAHRYFVPRTTPPTLVWPVHPGGGQSPMPYLVCPDPSAHLPSVAAPPTTTAPSPTPPDATT
ncbi:hypothetical protein GCM10010399_33250 [Dactylosporangium fulvum]